MYAIGGVGGISDHSPTHIQNQRFGLRMNICNHKVCTHIKKQGYSTPIMGFGRYTTAILHELSLLNIRLIQSKEKYGEIYD